jgi:hypothetical protein
MLTEIIHKLFSGKGRKKKCAEVNGVLYRVLTEINIFVQVLVNCCFS